MPIITTTRRRCVERYLITVHHRRSVSSVELPDGIDAHEAALRMKRLAESHKPIVDSPIADMGQPVYRLWKLIGSTLKDDTEQI